MNRHKKIIPTNSSKHGGCCAKKGPLDLAGILKCLPKFKDKNIIRSFENNSDAGVYKLSPNFALVQTVDIITPIFDNPYYFGSVAAANALSDIYAMGAKPLTALNIFCYPAKLNIKIVEQILKGSAEKVREANAVIIGGHTIEDEEIKYGLAVTGIVHPKKIIKNEGARVGDKLILTKPLGAGIILSAAKNGQRSIGKVIKKAALLSSFLNKKACEAMVSVGVNSCTDITGFGFLGHLFEMLSASNVGAIIKIKDLPIISEARQLAREGFFSSALYRNKEWIKNNVIKKRSVPEEYETILYDAQTSGGLLMSVHKNKLDNLLYELRRRKVPSAVVGKITDNLKEIVIE